MTNRPADGSDAPDTPHGSAVLHPDLIIGRHPVHGVLADGRVDDGTAFLLERAGFVYDEDLGVHRVPADTPASAEQACVQRAMKALAGRLSVAYLPGAAAAETAGEPPGHRPPP
ncbi:hypothetical protein [Streptomyces sp. bgisy027]|uniref:hypothetical protein n=1 Tax=Streptomyces sp. bgisy027 TaxID=3413770 RepID=UPI003D72A45A